MINEQREAINRLEKRIKDNKDYKTTQVWLTDDVVATQIVLSLIKEQNKIINYMANFINNNTPYTKDTRELESKQGIRTAKFTEQYFERKVNSEKEK